MGEQNKQYNVYAFENEAFGLSSIAQALPGDIGDTVVSKIDGAATKFALQFSNSFVQSAVHSGSEFLMLEVAQFLFDGIVGAASGNSLGFSIAQLKQLIKTVLEKLDIILDEPSRTCGVFIERALEAIENGAQKDAYMDFKTAIDNGVKGFIYASGSNKTGMMTEVTRCLIIADVARATFDENKNEFTKLRNDKQGKRIYSAISTNIDRLLDAQKNMKKKILFTRQKTFDAANKDVINNLLSQMFPVLVQFQPNHAQLAKYMPVGCLDKDFLKELLKKKKEKLFAAIAQISPETLKKHDELLLKAICQSGNVECLTSLLQSTKMDPDKELYAGYVWWSPLGLAAMNGNTAVARQLVETHGADVNRRNVHYGYVYSALGLAMGAKHLATVKLLVQLGNWKEVTVPSVSDVKMWSSIVNMGEGGREEIEQIVKSHGIKIVYE